MIFYSSTSILFFFFFNDTPTTEIYTLSLHDALPISDGGNPPRAASFPPRPAGDALQRRGSPPQASAQFCGARAAAAGRVQRRFSGPADGMQIGRAHV